MELKLPLRLCLELVIEHLLIVPYGIETMSPVAGMQPMGIF